jgi:toxin-antitoxin system PIN domain toxin
MIAVDTNLLVYAHRPGAEWNEEAFELLRSLAERPQPWAIPFPCVHEFLRNVTDPRIYTQPTPLLVALEQIGIWLESPTLRLLAEGGRHIELLTKVAVDGRVTGAKIHDARVATICIDHGVRELWTADRDFSRFPSLRTHNPLVG